MRVFIIIIGLIILPALGGDLNKEGCHNNRKTGDYHCHRGATAKPQSPAGPNLSGIPKIVDGDTIWIGETKIRLHGVDAPEAKQECYRVDGSPYRCGEAATDALRVLIGADPGKESETGGTWTGNYYRTP